ncbi:hypothetical protein TRAPUB_5603 [Trametes pubescens]|uniref:Uncharacterized protein n=1 Tax=Trametes pubescens TaxID=154538 RepID=A0A1M2V850_TRAPU|nr:hypothetical protein TRAPUB_5603 [Trametes pubescens]
MVSVLSLVNGRRQYSGMICHLLMLWNRCGASVYVHEMVKRPKATLSKVNNSAQEAHSADVLRHTEVNIRRPLRCSVSSLG